MARLTLLLEEFEYEVVHRSGQEMRHVDALSRNAVRTFIRSQREIAERARADDHLLLLKTLVEKEFRDDYLFIYSKKAHYRDDSIYRVHDKSIQNHKSQSELKHTHKQKKK
ncbi:hypothetical protein AVEN_224272-1 [Araneus ventricosus]|nr:hypothetical protein AVEN_224272-1 [Araneus ventricosus]